MNNLEKIIEVLESKIPHWEKFDTTVSKASVGWQIEHCLLVINKITLALQNPRTTYKWKFNLKKIIVFSGLKKIPKGVAKAPKHVLPTETTTRQSIERELILARENIKILDTLDKNLFFEHPYFGHLKLKEAKKMLLLHTKHHLDIIEDIIK